MLSKIFMDCFGNLQFLKSWKIRVGKRMLEGMCQYYRGLYRNLLFFLILARNLHKNPENTSPQYAVGHPAISRPNAMSLIPPLRGCQATRASAVYAASCVN